MTFYRTALLITIILSTTSTLADTWDISGHIGLEARGFWEQEKFSQQLQDAQTSAFLEPELEWLSLNESFRLKFKGFYRHDQQDEERSHADIRELYWHHKHESFDWLIGINTVFWGVTESNHLVDIINQTDAVEDLDQEDKLGQPMINLNIQQDWGLLSTYLLIGFRERTFPGVEGRLRTPIAIDQNLTLYESSEKKDHIDIAIRYSHFIGNLDIGFYWFHGTHREPRFIPSTNTFIPMYDQITQIGLDAQLTIDVWLWKLELIGRDTEIDHFWASAAGVEYTLFQIAHTNADLGLLLEHSYDDRIDTVGANLLDNDLFLGTRLSLNDVQDSSLLIGIMLDLELDSKSITLEAERRLGNNLKLECSLRTFSKVDPADPLIIFETDDHAQISLRWYY